MPDVNGLVGQAILETAVPIIVITLISLVIVFVVIRKLTGGGADKALLANGLTAQASILKMWDTGVTINDNPRIGLLLEVHPTSGAPFQVQVKKVISRLQTSQYQPGQTLEVKYDPADHTKVAITAILAGANTPGAAAQPADTQQLQATLVQQDALNRQIIATGQPAEAKVLQVQPLGIMVNGNNPYAVLNLEVRPAGRAPFVAQTQGVIAAQSLSKFQPGAIVAVRYDPADITRVAVEHS